MGVAECLEALAGAGCESDPENAAVLLSAAENLRHRIGAPLWLDEQAHRDRIVEVVRAELGEVRFGLAWEQGRMLSEDEVVAAALTTG